MHLRHDDAGSEVLRYPHRDSQERKDFQNQLDPHAASRILQTPDDKDGILITIEKVSAMPSVVGDDGQERRSMGATSAFNFGMGFGIWIGICAASLLPYELIHPATWKSKLLIGMPRGKDASRVKAMQLFPQIAKDLSRKKDHGRADALMLAIYGVKYGSAQVRPGAGSDGRKFVRIGEIHGKAIGTSEGLL